MKFFEDTPPDMDKPIMIAAMPDMGNVGGIVIDFINKAVDARVFRRMTTTYPTHVTDVNGLIGIPNQKWSYRYSDGLITFGGDANQPQDGSELHEVCQDITQVIRRFSAKLLYTAGGYHVAAPQDPPRAFVTCTTAEMADQLRRSGFPISPRSSVIRGFNGIMLGYAQAAGIRGIGIFGEMSEPAMPQYRAAKSIVKTLEKLTYMSFGDTAYLDAMAERTR